jgi:biopolymer transport protein ExbD
MDKPFLGRFRSLTNAQVIFVMLSVLLVWVAYLTADIQYNRQISVANQQNLAEQNEQIGTVLERQGNISLHTRNALLTQFEYAANHGGFATNATVQENTRALDNLTRVHNLMNLKLDKLLNQTVGSK